jgi:hypothetical protein
MLAVQQGWPIGTSPPRREKSVIERSLEADPQAANVAAATLHGSNSGPQGLSVCMMNADTPTCAQKEACEATCAARGLSSEDALGPMISKGSLGDRLPPSSRSWPGVLKGAVVLADVTNLLRRANVADHWNKESNN